MNSDRSVPIRKSYELTSLDRFSGMGFNRINAKEALPHMRGNSTILDGSFSRGQSRYSSIHNQNNKSAMKQNFMDERKTLHLPSPIQPRYEYSSQN